MTEKHKLPTWHDVLNLTLVEMRDEAIRMADECIEIMEPLQRENSECAAKYDEMLLLRKKAEAMPTSHDEAVAMSDVTTSTH